MAKNPTKRQKEELAEHKATNKGLDERIKKYEEMLKTYRYEKGDGGSPAGTAVLSPYAPASWAASMNRYESDGYF